MSKYVILTGALCLATLTATKANADGLTEFKFIVNLCSAAFAERPTVEVTYAELAKSWVKRVYGSAKVAYDVKKTESLITPLIGHIEIADAVAVLRGDNEQAATELEPSLLGKEGQQTLTRLNFGYQNGRWEFIDANRTTKPNRVDAKTYSVKLDKTVFSTKAAIGSCRNS